MTDKEKIKQWISREQDGLMDTQGNFASREDEGAYHILCSLDNFIDSLHEESISEDLEEEVLKTTKMVKHFELSIDDIVSFCAHHYSNWQKERIEEALLSEVLPCFMHGGEADEVMAKLDEVLSKKI